MSELIQLVEWADGLLASVAPAARKNLARQIANELRASQSKRIAVQQNPDGSSYAPRKLQNKLLEKKGAIRRNVAQKTRRSLFAKLRTAKYLKISASDNAALVTFSQDVQRIAQVHQFGLRDRVNKNRGPEIQYPERVLLGFTQEDIHNIGALVLSLLAT